MLQRSEQKKKNQPSEGPLPLRKKMTHQSCQEGLYPTFLCFLVLRAADYFHTKNRGKILLSSRSSEMGRGVIRRTFDMFESSPVFVVFFWSSHHNQVPSMQHSMSVSPKLCKLFVWRYFLCDWNAVFNILLHIMYHTFTIPFIWTSPHIWPQMGCHIRGVGNQLPQLFQGNQIPYFSPLDNSVNPMPCLFVFFVSVLCVRQSCVLWNDFRKIVPFSQPDIASQYGIWGEGKLNGSYSVKNVQSLFCRLPPAMRSHLQSINCIEYVRSWQLCRQLFDEMFLFSDFVCCCLLFIWFSFRRHV